MIPPKVTPILIFPHLKIFSGSPNLVKQNLNSFKPRRFLMISLFASVAPSTLLSHLYSLKISQSRVPRIYCPVFNFFCKEELPPIIWLTPTHSSRFNLRKQVTPDPMLSAEPSWTETTMLCVLYHISVLPTWQCLPWGAEIITYFPLHPHSPVSISSFLERQCHCYDTQLCRCEVS